MSKEKDNMGKQIREDIIFLRLTITNICFVGKPNQEEWFLVDAGLKSSQNAILEASEYNYGKDNPPKAIILTHGHFDHVGALEFLLERWDVPVYAHKLEMPYLTGQRDYPSPDPTVGGGLMSAMSPVYPKDAINLGSKVKELADGGNLGFMKGWRYIHTPGHTPGHISLFRDEDRTLIAGDAFITVNQESAVDVITQQKEVNGPPAYFTTDWVEAKKSVRKLAALKPSRVIAGHGQPLEGEKLTKELERLAKDFDTLAVPDQGKYVKRQDSYMGRE